MNGERVLAEASEAYRAALGERLLAAYALGSLAHGGFSELVSDVDLGLILSDPLQRADMETIQAVADAEKSKGPPLHQRLSVFWGTPATLGGEQDGGRFPALDRLDLIENGRLLFGRDDARRGLPVPATRELLVTGADFALTYLAGSPRPGSEPGARLGSMQPAADNAVEEVRSPDMLLRHGIRQTTKLVLFPVRFLYTAATGRVGTNHAAAAWYSGDGQAPGTELVAAAVTWRAAPPQDQVLASGLLREHLLPLYLYYIDDHIKRLASIGETRLAEGFREWRVRLTRPPDAVP